MAERVPFLQRKRMTRLGEALAKSLNAQSHPLVTNYEIFLEVWRLYERGGIPYLRGEFPTKETFRRTRRLLHKEGVIRPDSDYSALWRVMSKTEASPEEIICSVDPSCYISHMSAMQRYGLTNRRPEALFITLPPPKIRRQKLIEMMKKDYGDALNDPNMANEIEQPKALSHPSRVRGRAVEFHTTKFIGEFVDVRGSMARIATIGQTFLDTLELPDYCGGMIHVLDTWSTYARKYLNEIITIVDQSEKPILKVRAGYILDECLGVEDERIENWVRYAQRGSSRVLDPGEPFAPEHSEKWMLSINV